jgi:hypothetical protein
MYLVQRILGRRGRPKSAKSLLLAFVSFISSSLALLVSFFHFKRKHFNSAVNFLFENVTATNKIMDAVTSFVQI